MGLKGEEHATGAILLGFRMRSLRFARTQGENAADVFDEATGPLVKTAQGRLGIIRELVLVEHVFPLPQIVTGNLPYAPLLREPRFKFVFFSSCRTLSCERESITPSVTTLSAIRGRGQHAAPAGGSLPASIVP